MQINFKKVLRQLFLYL